MDKHINHLSAKEQHLMIHAPLYVSVLIAEADGDIKNKEKARIVELVHIKSFSEHHGLNELYKELDHDVAEELRTLIASLPDDRYEREVALVDLISGLNHILPKCKYSFASHYYKSLREFAHYIATFEGGFWGIGAITKAEAKFVKLPMINEPQEHQN